MRASTVSAPTRSARITSAEVPFTVPPMTAAPGGLRDRQRLAGDHRLVDRPAPLDDRAVHGNPLAGPDTQLVTDADLGERDLRPLPVGLDALGRLRREVEQRAQRVTRARARPQLEHLAEQHQRHDHRRGFEVERRLPAVTERVRERCPARASPPR